MWALDQAKSYFTGDVHIDNPEIRQELKQAFPNLARAGNEFDDLEYLPKEYIQEKMVPEMMQMQAANFQQFKWITQKISWDLYEHVTNVETNLRYTPKDGNALPGVQQLPDKLTSSAKSVFKSTENFIADVAGLRTDVEKEQALLAEIITSANRSIAKFDKYVAKWDGKQYGNKANDWLEIDSANIDIRRPANDTDITNNVENVPRLDFVTVVNDVVKMAQDPSNVVNGSTVWDGTRIAKLAYLASWMSALEEWCDTVLPNMVAEATTNVVVGTVSTVGNTIYDTGAWVASAFPMTTLFILSAIWYASWKTGSLVKWILNIPSVPVRWAAAAAWSFWPTAGVAPHIKKFSEIISFSDKENPGSNGWSSEIRTPDRFVPVNPGDLKEFLPGEANHEEYYKKTLEAIKNSGVAPSVLPPATPIVDPNEVSKRTDLFKRLDKEYRKWEMSISEYLKRTEDIIAWRGKMIVVDHTGKTQKAESAKNVVQRISDRTPGVGVFTRNKPNGSSTLSENAIQAAQKRIKGTSYESVDFAGEKVEFAVTATKALFEEFRDKLQKYTQMQEWDATNREILAKEWLRTQIQTIDILAKQAEITLKSNQLAATPHTVPWAPMMSPTWVPIPTQVPNPLITTLNTELSTLTMELWELNKQVGGINREIATLKGKPHAYVPTGNTRANFQNDIRALKLELSNPGATTGLIQRINTTVWAGTIPESAFDAKDLKIDKLRLLDVVKTALKK